MKKCMKILLGIITLGIGILVVYNIYSGPESFFNISIGNVLTVSVAIYFAFYLTQKNNDIRVQKEVYRKIIQAIQEISDDKNNYIISENFDIRMWTMTKRSLNNYSYMLKKYAKKMGVEDSANRIIQHIDEYVTFVGNHIDDKAYLSKSEAELRRPLELINNEAIEMMMELYK